MQPGIPKCSDMCYRMDIGCYILKSWEDVSIGVEWLPNFSFFIGSRSKKHCQILTSKNCLFTYQRSEKNANFRGKLEEIML